jgi:GTP cyclohydrolase I
MPDVANEAHLGVQGKLELVGMQKVELPIILPSEKGVNVMAPGKADLFVNLSDPSSKGIHMSRLYQIAMNQFESAPLSFELLEATISEFKKSHSDISTEAAIKVHFELMTKRSSLISQLEGWRSYPITLSASSKSGKISYEAEVEVMYSSTCPCSASLARQLIQNRFLESFQNSTYIDRDTMHEWLGQESSICATPHSQRSIAQVKVKLDQKCFNPVDLIDQVEQALQTTVQAMVKREDEQEFAKINGQNLMFCEDAARKVKATLEKSNYSDFRCKVEHLESLHPHDAVAVSIKGVKDGFTA